MEADCVMIMAHEKALHPLAQNRFWPRNMSVLEENGLDVSYQNTWPYANRISQSKTRGKRTPLHYQVLITCTSWPWHSSCLLARKVTTLPLPCEAHRLIHEQYFSSGARNHFNSQTNTSRNLFPGEEIDLDMVDHNTCPCFVGNRHVTIHLPAYVCSHKRMEAGRATIHLGQCAKWHKAPTATSRAGSDSWKRNLIFE